MSARRAKRPRLHIDPLAEQRALLKTIQEKSAIELYRLGRKFSENEYRVKVLYAAVDVALSRHPWLIGRNEYMHAEVNSGGRVKQFVVVAANDEEGGYEARSISKDCKEVKYVAMEDWLPYCKAREKVRFRRTVEKTLPAGVTLSFRTQLISYSVNGPPKEQSTVVTGVEFDSQADLAGFRNGDVVVRIDGKPVRTTEITGKAVLRVREAPFIILHAK